ncbi:MAG: LacI family DNA-binding transcriptional regulator [Eubacteriales bacterium]|nr:LacI family DNA-binding transcriptional regulator [Eubacteriales bacterium]
MNEFKGKVTLQDIADATGFSIATVSRAINSHDSVKKNTYDKIIRAMRDLGYDNAPIHHQSKLILILLPDIDNPFYSDLIKGISDAADRQGYQEIIVRTGTHPLTYSFIADIVIDTHAEGMITLDAISDIEALEKLRDRIPLVQCAEYNDKSSVPFVSIDDIHAARQVVNYIVSKGRRKIAFINGPLRYKYARHRLEGFYRGLEQAGIVPNPGWIVQLPEFSYDAALSIATQLLSQPDRPEAIFASSDVFAGAVVKAARRLGLSIPQDLGVIGFDNTNISIMCEPAMTTVKQPQYQMGFIACEMLIEQINNRSIQPRQIMLDVELIIRESM